MAPATLTPTPTAPTTARGVDAPPALVPAAAPPARAVAAPGARDIALGLGGAVPRRVAGPRVVAHRGHSAVAPENTLAAIVAADTADLVEIDVDTCADGVPFVLHDATVDRTTNGTGTVRELSSATLDGLDAGGWFAPAFAGQRVPRLTTALALMASRGQRVLLEVKRPQSRATVARYVRELRGAGMLDRAVLQSFDEGTLRHARELAPDLRLAVLRRTLDRDPVAVARDLGVVAYNPDWRALRTRPDVVRALQAAGVAVVPWTVDEPAEWGALCAAGVDGIITNRSGDLARWLADRAARPAAEPVAA